MTMQGVTEERRTGAVRGWFVRWFSPLCLLAATIVTSEAQERPVPPLSPQGRSAEEVDAASRARHAARQEVLASARAGDFVEVRQLVTAAVEGRRTARSIEVDLARELAEVSFNLEESGEPDAAARVGEMAREHLGRLRESKQTREAVTANLLEAALWERVYHDAAEARAAYQRVLEHDGANPSAREGLARLDLADATTAEKVKEQERLLADREAAVQR